MHFKSPKIFFFFYKKFILFLAEISVIFINEKIHENKLFIAILVEFSLWWALNCVACLNCFGPTRYESQTEFKRNFILIGARIRQIDRYLVSHGLWSLSLLVVFNLHYDSPATTTIKIIITINYFVFMLSYALCQHHRQRLRALRCFSFMRSPWKSTENLFSISFRSSELWAESAINLPLVVQS